MFQKFLFLHWVSLPTLIPSEEKNKEAEPEASYSGIWYPHCPLAQSFVYNSDAHAPAGIMRKSLQGQKNKLYVAYLP